MNDPTRLDAVGAVKQAQGLLEQLVRCEGLIVDASKRASQIRGQLFGSYPEEVAADAPRQSSIDARLRDMTSDLSELNELLAQINQRL